MTQEGELSQTFRVGKYKVCFTARQVVLGDHKIDLPWRCFEALLVLIEANGEVVERDILFRRLWPDVNVEESSLNHAIAKLRRQLGEAGDESLIETIPGRGYRLVVKPERVSSQPASPPGTLTGPAAYRRGGWLQAPSRSLIAALGIVAVCVPAAFYGWGRWSKHSKALALVEEGFELVREGRVPQVAEASARFSRAVELDPKLALAYAGLAEAMARSVDGSRSHAKEMAERSLRIDPRCADCQGIAGWILLTSEWQFADALRLLQAAARQKPQDARIQLWNAQALACSGRLEEALQEIDKAVSSRPTDAAATAMRAGILYFTGRYDESIRAARLSLGLRPGYTAACDWIYRAGLARGRVEEALEAKAFLTASFTGNSVDARQAYEHRLNEAYRAGGMERVVQALLAETSEGLALVENRYDRAALRMRIGDREGALGELENVFEWRPFHCIYTGVDPVFAAIRKDPRFHNVLARIGLDKVLISYKQPVK